MGAEYDWEAGVYVAADQPTDPVLTNEGFAGLVIVVLCGIIIIGQAWRGFRSWT